MCLHQIYLCNSVQVCHHIGFRQGILFEMRGPYQHVHAILLRALHNIYKYNLIRLINTCFIEYHTPYIHQLSFKCSIAHIWKWTHIPIVKFAAFISKHVISSKFPPLHWCMNWKLKLWFPFSKIFLVNDQCIRFMDTLSAIKSKSL